MPDQSRKIFRWFDLIKKKLASSKFLRLTKTNLTGGKYFDFDIFRNKQRPITGRKTSKIWVLFVHSHASAHLTPVVPDVCTSEAGWGVGASCCWGVPSARQPRWGQVYYSYSKVRGNGGVYGLCVLVRGLGASVAADLNMGPCRRTCKVAGCAVLPHCLERA